MTERSRRTAGGGRKPGTPPGRPTGQPMLPAVLLLFALFVVCATARITRPVTLPLEGPPGPWPDMRLDLNTAGAAELTALPGIGPRLAGRIVTRRAANGPFRAVDELAEVHRIGPVLVEDAREHVVVDAGRP